LPLPTVPAGVGGASFQLDTGRADGGSPLFVHAVQHLLERGARHAARFMRVVDDEFPNGGGGNSRRNSALDLVRNLGYVDSLEDLE
jgi:hypothetical protein